MMSQAGTLEICLTSRNFTSVRKNNRKKRAISSKAK